jgi:hypothetical protein
MPSEKKDEVHSYLFVNGCDGRPIAEDVEGADTIRRYLTADEARQYCRELARDNPDLLVGCHKLDEMQEDAVVQYLDGVFVDRFAKPLEDQS